MLCMAIWTTTYLVGVSSSDPLEHILQSGSFPQVRANIKSIWNHHLELRLPCMLHVTKLQQNGAKRTETCIVMDGGPHTPWNMFEGNDVNLIHSWKLTSGSTNDDLENDSPLQRGDYTCGGYDPISMNDCCSTLQTEGYSCLKTIVTEVPWSVDKQTRHWCGRSNHSDAWDIYHLECWWILSINCWGIPWKPHP